MMDLAFNSRQVGWVQGPRMLPHHPTCSISHFIWSRMLYAMLNVVLLIAALLYEDGDPDTLLHHTEVNSCTMVAKFIWTGFSGSLAWAIAMVNGVCLIHTIFAIPLVGLGLSGPGDWPALFGSFWDTYSLRRFWGRTWHQLMRPTLSMIGKHVACRVCGFREGTIASSSTQLFVAFMVSGLIHTGGDYLVFQQFRPHILLFFLLHAVAISFENFMIWLTKPLTARCDRRVSRIVGYIWVCGWFCFTCPNIWFYPVTTHNVRLVLLDGGHITALDYAAPWGLHRRR